MDALLRHYQNLFEGAPQAYIVTDAGGRIQEANAEAIRLLHIPAAVVRGKSLFTHIALTDRVLFREAVKQRTSADVPRYWVSQLKPRNQPSVIVAVSAVSMVDDDGRVVGASWILQDISGLKQVEAELRRTRDELERRVQERTADLEASNRRKEELVEELRRASEAKDEFLGLLSHELRTSMTLIYGGIKAVRRLSDRLEAEEAASMLENVEQETDAMYRMIEDLLNLARLELGEQLTTEPVMVQHVIRRFVRNFEESRPKREVVVDLPDDLEPALAEPTYVEQVLRNLVSNAEKYTPSDSPIELRAAENGGTEITISVLDRGPGIPQDELDAVFERFYRSSHTPKRVRGMGMGLTVCKRLVEAQRGRIWLATRAEGGLEVSFTLPVARDGPD
jgi:PAS domain S-box-containing protein